MKNQKLILKGLSLTIILLQVITALLFFLSLITITYSLTDSAASFSSDNSSVKFTPLGVQANFNIPVYNKGFFNLNALIKGKVISFDNLIIVQNETEKIIKPNTKEILSLNFSIPITQAMNIKTLGVVFEFKTLNDLTGIRIEAEIPREAIQ